MGSAHRRGETNPGSLTQDRLRGTLGDQRKHWFRAKFFQQYRLFYRFDSDAHVIVLAWVNDEQTLRAYGSRTDAYVTFRGMLENGNQPDDLDALLREAKAVSEQFATNITTMQEI